MPTLQDIIRIHHIKKVELQAWMDQQWIRPEITPAGPMFDEADEARIVLIRELRQEFMVNEDAIGVVLSLLDQLYAARRVLKCVNDAIGALPTPLREELRSRLKTTEPER